MVIDKENAQDPQKIWNILNLCKKKCARLFSSSKNENENILQNHRNGIVIDGTSYESLLEDYHFVIFSKIYLVLQDMLKKILWFYHYFIDQIRFYFYDFQKKFTKFWYWIWNTSQNWEK